MTQDEQENADDEKMALGLGRIALEFIRTIRYVVETEPMVGSPGESRVVRDLAKLFLRLKDLSGE